MLEINDCESIKKGIRYVPFDINTNSRIYVNGFELTKVPSKIILAQGTLEDVLKHIDEKEIDCCVKVKKLIYKKDKFVAYTITFYKDYKSLIKHLNRDFVLKKQDCLNVEKAFTKLTENNLEVCDAVLSNILLNKNGNILICDLDGLKINNEEDLEMINRKCLFILALAYIYKIPTNQILALVRHKSHFLNKNNDEFERLFLKLYKGETVKMEELLNLIDERDVKVKRKELKRDVRKLMSNPYYRMYFGY